MSESFLVRCSAAPGRAMAGVYAARVTATGIVATWKQERAARYESEGAAVRAAHRLTGKFAGTTWEICHG